MVSLSLPFPLGWSKVHLMGLPAHAPLSYHWNFGSFLGVVLGFQLMTGLFLSMNYTMGESAFDSLIVLIRDSWFGFLLRWAHLNGASLFFALVYFHLFRGLFVASFRLILPWGSGVTILILLMVIAFLGYVLPWGQMSLWGATVITNLLSTLPFIGEALVVWVWGGFSVGKAALGVFYSLHFFLPFLLLSLVLFHMLFLHETGSSSSLFLHTHESKMKFHLSFSVKDSMNLAGMGAFFSFLFFSPYVLGDPENFNLANPLSSPLHIQPEWYFLFAYAILRSVPNKLGGVIALLFSVVVLYFPSFLSKKKIVFMKDSKMVVWWFMGFCFLLTWIGGNPVESPFVVLGQGFTSIYFILVFLFVM